MEIEDLKLKQLTKLAALFTGEKENNKPDILKDYIGKYVICRTRNEGINAGFVKELDASGVIMTDARRLFFHKPKDENLAWYEGVATSGLSSDSKISAPTEKVIIEDYSLTICTEEAKTNIMSHPSTQV